MSVSFRPAVQADVPGVVALLADDDIGGARETAPLADYKAAFARMDERCQLIVGEADGQLVACYDLIILDGLNACGQRRAQVEGVRVASHLRGHGLGRKLMEDAMDRARTVGAAFMEMMSNAARHDTHAFYERLGFTRSHVGFKRKL
ncbi:MAG: GNAT family N-acetyltransferase [Paracoccaceae bacterium]